MTQSDEFSRVTPELLFWQAYDSGCRTDVSCCAHIVDRSVILVDPIQLSVHAERELLLQGEPHGVILTSGNHFRAAAFFQKRFGVPIAAHQEAQKNLGLTLNESATDGQILFGALQVIELEGAGPGEIALYREEAGILSLGDIIIHLAGHDFSILPDKYCQNPQKARLSLQKLKVLSPKILTFAHGLPIVSLAEARLNQLVENSRPSR